MRKILSNNFKSKRMNGSKQNKIGNITGLMDKNKNYLKIGDCIRIDNIIGVLLYNTAYNRYGLFYGTNGNDYCPFDEKSYYKFIEIPMDNGMRMEITKLF